jgi:DNA-binding response OmpR family regulator
MHPTNLLIVDDEQDFVATLLKRLQRRGIACRGALTGSEALDCFRQEYFDTVLLDMKLPDLDGNTVLRGIKKIRPATRVLILTGHASYSSGREGLSEGAADYLLKPVEFETLLEKLLFGTAKHSRGSPEQEHW